MCSNRDDAALPAPGFPIRESAGQSLFSSSPRLIAAVHALRRLLVPRHPPCALHILTVIVPCAAEAPHGSVIHSLFGQLCAVFKVRGGRDPEGLSGPVSQNSTACVVRSRAPFRYRLGRRV